MPGATGSISLLELLARLLADHVPKEAEFQETEHRYMDASRRGGGSDDDPPIWEQTPWDIAVRWLARRSAIFHSIQPADIAGLEAEEIDIYEHQLREYLSDLKRGGPSKSNPAAAELLEFERQGIAAQLCKELGAALPADIQQPIAEADQAALRPGEVLAETDAETTREIGSKGPSQPSKKSSTEQGEASKNVDGNNQKPAAALTRVVTLSEAARLHSGQNKANPSDYIARQIKAGTLTRPIGSGKSWRFIR